MCVCEYPCEHVWVGGAHTRASSHMSAHVMNLQMPSQAVPTGSEMPEHNFRIKTSYSCRAPPTL